MFFDIIIDFLGLKTSSSSFLLNKYVFKSHLKVLTSVTSLKLLGNELKTFGPITLKEREPYLERV